MPKRHMNASLVLARRSSEAFIVLTQPPLPPDTRKRAFRHPSYQNDPEAGLIVQIRVDLERGALYLVKRGATTCTVQPRS